MTALWHARASGRGQYVDVAMADSILALSELVVSQFSYLGVSPQPVGNGIPGVAPFGTVRVRDGVIVIAAPHDPQFHALCRLIDRVDLITDPRFIDEPARAENQAELTRQIEAFMSRHSKQQLRELFGGKVPFSPIYDAREIFADPHFAVRDMLPQVQQPGSARMVAVPGVPVKLSHTPGQVRWRAPILGEHTHEVLAEYGLGAERIEQLQQAGVIGTR